jgi:antitoxin component YwqK of YwqJK toxin-antitoxin module
MRSLLFALAVLIAQSSFAQREMCEMQYYFGEVPPAEGMYKHTDKGMYFREKSGKTFYLSTDYTDFREYDRQHHLIQKGDVSADRRGNIMQQDGYWTYYYPNGKLRMEGYFYEGHAVGTWKIYYPNGRLQKQFTYTRIDPHDGWRARFVTALSGSYLEFYPTGKKKIEGFYAIKINEGAPDTIYVTDPVTNETVMHPYPPAHNPNSVPDGTWKYYSPDGNLEKTEDMGFIAADVASK